MMLTVHLPYQDGMEQEAFKQYFFAADVFLAIYADDMKIDTSNTPLDTSAIVETRIPLEKPKGRSWEDSGLVAGFYYV